MDDKIIVVPENERNLTARDLFYNWFAANIGIMGIVFGAIIVSFKLSFIQAIIAALIASMSFAIPGWISIIGKNSGITTFKMSRSIFGVSGNKIPNGIAWINMVGWLAVNVVSGTLLIVSLFKSINFDKGTFTTVISLCIFGILVILSGIMNENTLSIIQTYISYIFGALTLIILGVFAYKTNWNYVWSMNSGSWTRGVLPAISIIAAGTGISWSIAAADWSAYVKPKTNSTSAFWNTTLGGVIPLFIIMLGGILLSTVEPSLASASNPFDVMYHALPSWLSTIYFIVAAGGLIPQCIISLRSARINLETVGIYVSQKTSLLIHSLIVILIPIYVLFISGDFLNNFQLFLGFLGICLAPWITIFLCDNIMFRKTGYSVKDIEDTSKNKFNKLNIFIWAFSVIIGFLFTNNSIWSGPFSHGIFRDNSLGIFVSGIFSILLMLISFNIKKRKFQN